MAVLGSLPCRKLVLIDNLTAFATLYKEKYAIKPDIMQEITDNIKPIFVPVVNKPCFNPSRHEQKRLLKRLLPLITKRS